MILTSKNVLIVLLVLIAAHMITDLTLLFVDVGEAILKIPLIIYVMNLVPALSIMTQIFYNALTAQDKLLVAHFQTDL